MSHLVLGRENTGKFIIIVTPYNMEVGVLYIMCILFQVVVSGIFVCFLDPVQHHCCTCSIPGIFITVPPQTFLGFITCIISIHCFSQLCFIVLEGNSMPRYYS